MYSNLIGNELRAIRNRCNYTLKDVEKITGIHAQTLSEYENSKVRITVSTLEKIVKSYGLDLYIFFKTIYEYTHKNKEE